MVKVHLDATGLGGGYKSTVWLEGRALHGGTGVGEEAGYSINLLPFIIANIIKWEYENALDSRREGGVREGELREGGGL